MSQTKKNFLYNIVYQILIMIVPLILAPYLSRVLGAKGVGIYSYTYSIVYYFMIFCLLGISNYGNRSIAKVRENKRELSNQFWNIYLIQFLMSTIVVALYLIYCFTFAGSYKEILLIQSLFIFSSMLDINWFFFGLEKFKYTISRNTIVKILSMVLIFVFVKGEGDVWKYSLIMAGSALLSQLLLWMFLKKEIYFVKFKAIQLKKHFIPIIKLFLPVIAVSIYRILDKIMLGFLAGVEEVAFYENAEKIVNVPITILTALGVVMLPKIANLLSKNQEKTVLRYISSSLRFIIFLSIPITLGLISISTDFVPLYFGPGFEKSISVINILSLTICFLGWGNVIRTQYLIPKERDREYIISAILGAVANFVMNCIFIPLYGCIGACYGTLLAEFIVAFYQSWCLRKELPFMKYISLVIPFLIKGLIMFAFVSIFQYLDVNVILRIFLQCLCGTIIYGIFNIKYILEIISTKRILFTQRREDV